MKSQKAHVRDTKLSEVSTFYNVERLIEKDSTRLFRNLGMVSKKGHTTRCGKLVEIGKKTGLSVKYSVVCESNRRMCPCVQIATVLAILRPFEKQNVIGFSCRLLMVTSLAVDI